MSVDRAKWFLAGLLIATFWAGGAGRSAAKTVEVEVEEEDVQAAELSQAADAKASAPAKPSRPAAPKSPAAPAKQAKAAAPTSTATTPKASAAGPAEAVSLMPRVRVGEKIGLYYFIRAGFSVPDSSRVPSVAKVMGLPADFHYSTPKTCFIELTSSKNPVGVGDLLVVYRTSTKIREDRSGFSGFWVRNLAVVKVLEVDKNRCLVEVKRSFFPFERGDKLRPYEDEMARWKQAQTKKPLPDHPVKCFVAGVEGNPVLFNQTDAIVLTAGSKKGVVEGQVFQIREGKATGFLEPKVRFPQAAARVFYSGADHSMAQIIRNHAPIEGGFEAHYQP